MEQLSTNYDFTYDVKPEGLYTTVTRKSDGATKTFFNASHKDDKAMRQFMASMTDELLDGYWPRPRKK
jgi:hypothetical protein